MSEQIRMQHEQIRNFSNQFSVMKKLYLAIASITLAIQLNSQGKINPDNTSQQWQKLLPGTELSAQEFIQQIHQNPYQINSHWEHLDAEVNDSWTHHKYQQYYKGVQVYQAQLLVHEQRGAVKKYNGLTVADIDLNPTPQVSDYQAIQLALGQVKAQKYLWEDEHMESSLKAISGNIEDSYYPSPQLVILPSNKFPGVTKPVLSWVMDVQCAIPHQNIKVFVDAHSGEIIFTYNDLKVCGGSEGDAETLYHGNRKIQTSFHEDHYVLYDSTRGRGLYTITRDTLDFTDDDNNWEKGEFASRFGALDVHWGTAATYDYYKDVLNRKSVDDRDHPIYSYVHLNDNVNNAFWNGRATIYGDGDGGTYGPFTSIDVVAHEITHGMTQHSAGLEYLYESGALNESFSDIFGKAVEQANDPDNFTWGLGNRFALRGNGFRNMADPNSFQHPQEYEGSFWHTETTDNGGVHINSGVQNYWYYLLCEGGSGTNEKGNHVPSRCNRL